MDITALHNDVIMFELLKKLTHAEQYVCIFVCRAFRDMIYRARDLRLSTMSANYSHLYSRKDVEVELFMQNIRLYRFADVNKVGNNIWIHRAHALIYFDEELIDYLDTLDLAKTLNTMGLVDAIKSNYHYWRDYPSGEEKTKKLIDWMRRHNKFDAYDHTFGWSCKHHMIGYSIRFHDLSLFKLLGGVRPLKLKLNPFLGMIINSDYDDFYGYIYAGKHNITKHIVENIVNHLINQQKYKIVKYIISNDRRESIIKYILGRALEDKADELIDRLRETGWLKRLGRE